MSAISYDHPLGDLEPDFVLQLLQAASVGDEGAVLGDDGMWRKPVPLSAAERVTLRWWARGADAPVLTADADSVDRDLGKVKRTWQPGDFVQTTPGEFMLRATISWTGQRPQTVPTRAIDAFLFRVYPPLP